LISIGVPIIAGIVDRQVNSKWILLIAFQAALEAPRVLSLNSSKHFSGPYGVCLFTKM